MRRTLMRRAVVAFAATALAAGTLVACSSDEDEHNDADVAFASEMIPHHAQAVHMAAMVDRRGVSPELRTLAAEMAAAQEPEIETMAGWLEEWGEDVPSVDGMPMGGMDHRGMGHRGMGPRDGGPRSMPGMMSGEDLESLAARRGASFEQRWLTMMIEHHRGAIEMAEIEQQEGKYAPAVELAAEIAATQEAEIAEMEAMLER
ncbi:MAG: DUF305 domain-containing protein [Nocardioides sp.]|nr:DUF305 domain-containing protein [Nocardioides sp.]